MFDVLISETKYSVHGTSLKTFLLKIIQSESILYHMIPIFDEYSQPCERALENITQCREDHVIQHFLPFP